MGDRNAEGQIKRKGCFYPWISHLVLPCPTHFTRQGLPVGEMPTMPAFAASLLAVSSSKMTSLAMSKAGNTDVLGQCNNFFSRAISSS